MADKGESIIQHERDDAVLIDPTARHRGFDFSYHMRRVCGDMVRRLPELCHIELPAVAIGFAQARQAGPHGVQATLTPMRFKSGSLTTRRNGQTLTVQRFYDAEGTEMLYLLSFYLPRFLDCPFEEKLVTILHELWHISPHFNGDLRRYGGRCYAHGTSREKFDAVVQQLARHWLAKEPPRHVHAFLSSDFRQLTRRYGRVQGTRIPTPRLIPLARTDSGAE